MKGRGLGVSRPTQSLGCAAGSGCATYGRPKWIGRQDRLESSAIRKDDPRLNGRGYDLRALRFLKSKRVPNMELTLPNKGAKTLWVGGK
jgi:hypothetical protein